MQPYALVHSDVPKHRKKKRDGADLGSDIIEDVAPVDDDLQPSPERKPKGQYYRQREQVPPFIYSPRKVGSSSTSRSRTTMADARSEHLLLAARKIGKQRASILSAMNYYQPVDAKSGTTPAAAVSTSAKGKGRAEDGGLTFTEYIPKVPTTPKTPQKSARPPVLSPNIPPPFMNASPGFTSMVQPYAYVPGTVPGPAYALYSPSAYTYPPPPPLNSPSRPVGSTSTSNGKLSSSSASLSTPSSARRTATTAQPPSSPSKGGPSTPFDKLISAARSVLSPATALDTPTKKQTATQNRSTGRRLPSPGNDGSPTPKRRRVQGTANQQMQGESNLGRTASALDVLADQAAVFGSNSRKSGEVQRSATERNGESSQGNSAPVVDVGGSRSVFSTADPFVPHTKAAQKKPRTRAPRKSLEPAAKLSRAPKRGKAQATQAAQSTRSRTQSPANVALNDVSRVPEEDARTDTSRRKTRSPSVNSNSASHRAGEDVAGADDTASNRASTPGQDDVRQRWLAKLGMCIVPLRVESCIDPRFMTLQGDSNLISDIFLIQVSLFPTCLHDCLIALISGHRCCFIYPAIFSNSST